MKHFLREAEQQEGVWTMKKAMFSGKQIAKMLSQHVFLPAVYDLHRPCRTEKNLVVFADAHHDRRPEAMELLYRRLRKDKRLRIRQLYLDFGKASAREVLEFSSRFMSLYTKASVVLICDNFLPVTSCRKKKDTLVVQLWHAAGCYKKFGYDSEDDIPRGYVGDVFRNMDLVTVSSEAARGPFESAMRKGPEQVEALGISRTDLYYSEKWRRKCIEQFRKLYPEVYEDNPERAKKAETAGRKTVESVDDESRGDAEKGEYHGSVKKKKVVLYAPTFRGNAGMPELDLPDMKKLQDELGDGYLVLTRLHPHMKDDQKLQADNCPIPPEQLYPVVDVLIGDYSSLIYEYLLCSEIGRREEEKNKGILVLYVPDLDQYERRRGFYMDIRELPGEIVKTESGLAEAVRRASSQVRAPESVSNFLDTYMSACDGHATERIARRILDRCGLS